MTAWRVTWWDGVNVREIVVNADAYNVVSAASGAGVVVFSIIKIERVAS